MVHKKNGTPQSAKTVSGRKKVVDSDDDEQAAPAGGGSPGEGSRQGAGVGSPQTSDSAVKKCKINRHCLVTLTIGVISMRELVLSNAVPLK